MVLVIVVLSVFAVAKHCVTGGLADSEVAAGLVLTSSALVSKDLSQFDEAESHYIDAASVSPLDAYPAFLLRLNRLLAEVSAGGESEQIVYAISEQDWSKARSLAEETGKPGTKPRAYWERAIASLEAQAATRAP